MINLYDYVNILQKLPRSSSQAHKAKKNGLVYILTKVLLLFQCRIGKISFTILNTCTLYTLPTMMTTHFELVSLLSLFII